MRHELSLYLKTLNPILSKNEHPGRVGAVLNVWYLSVGVTASVSLYKCSFSQSPFRDGCLMTWPGFPGNSKLGHTLSHRSLRKLRMPQYFSIYLCLWYYPSHSDYYTITIQLIIIQSIQLVYNNIQLLYKILVFSGLCSSFKMSMHLQLLYVYLLFHPHMPHLSCFMT